MKILSLLVLITFPIISWAAPKTNFSGFWRGECNMNGASSAKERTLEQASDGSTLTINGFVYELTKPTEVPEAWTDKNDNTLKALTIYDFRWNEATTELVTSAQWVWWYANKSGSGFGGGEGYIRMEGEELVMFRKYIDDGANFEETCRYKKIQK